MRILWVKTELLHPVDKGGRIRTYQMLRALSRRHNVTYLCLDDGRRRPMRSSVRANIAQEVVVVPFRPAAKRSAGSLSICCEISSHRCRTRSHAIDSPTLRERVRSLARRSGSDRV